MATAEHISGSILSSVVEHEKSLLAKLEQAREEAKGIVERARTQAQAQVQADAAKLADDVAGLRRSAEQSRTAAFDATLQVAEERLVGVRKSAEARVPQVADKVFELFVPKGSGNS